MRWIAATLVALTLAGGASVARADDASRLRLAHEVVDVTHAGDNMKAVIPLMVQQMRTLLIQQGNAGEAQVDAYVQHFQDRLGQEIPAFTGLVAKIYAQDFSDDDLANLLTFYRTPTGQHLVGKQPEIAKGLLVAGQEWGKQVAGEVLAEMQKEKAAAPPPKL